MQLLPDIGDLLLLIALLFGALIAVFETLARRQEHRDRTLLLDDIAREYADYHRLGYF